MVEIPRGIKDLGKARHRGLGNTKNCKSNRARKARSFEGLLNCVKNNKKIKDIRRKKAIKWLEDHCHH